MPGLDPGIHEHTQPAVFSWMDGSSPRPSDLDFGALNDPPDVLSSRYALAGLDPATHAIGPHQAAAHGLRLPNVPISLHLEQPDRVDGRIKSGRSEEYWLDWKAGIRTVQIETLNRTAVGQTRPGHGEG